jgi:hypothetical protein
VPRLSRDSGLSLVEVAKHAARNRCNATFLLMEYAAMGAAGRVLFVVQWAYLVFDRVLVDFPEAGYRHPEDV